MFCPKCGKQLVDGYKFCTGCGNQIAQPGSEPQKPVKPKIQPPKVQQSNLQPEGVQNIPDMQAPNMSFHLQKTEETKQMENKNKRMMIILIIVLVVLILVAIGMAAYYFSVLRDDSRSDAVESERVTEDIDTEDEQDNEPDNDENDSEVDSEEQVSEETPAEEQEEEARVTSDTNEVIKDTIIYSIPKSVYSYDFDDSLGNAQVVIRKEAETMPEIADNVEPQYVSGIDGKAVYLDGSYGIRLSDVQKVGSSYTIAFWMKADDFHDWAPFIHIGYDLLDQSKRCRLWLGQKTDGVSVAPIISSEQARTGTSYEIRPTGVLSSMQPGVWYYIVFTVDGTKQGSSGNCLLGTLYVAGQYAGGGNIALDTMNVDDFDVYLGINCWDALYPVAFDGVKIWDQVLDANQVEDLFNAYQ